MQSLITAPKADPQSFKFTENLMKLRFKVNQAECFRRGINCDRSIVTVEVDPGTLSQEDRNLIADRLDGIDVLELTHKREDNANVISKHYEWEGKKVENYREVDSWKPVLIEANEPTFEGLMEAIRANQKDVDIKAATSSKFSGF